jgi:glucokinase
MKGDTFPRLLGDIGGTNARFAWQAEAGAAVSDAVTYPCADYPTLEAAMRRYLGEHQRAAPRQAAIGIANPITGDHVQMTNHHWSFSIAGLRDALGLERLLVINDFTALALSLPALTPDELLQVGGGAPVPEAPVALLGPGTGLGVSGLLPMGRGRGEVPLNGEGGHVTLSATDAREAAVIELLRQRFGHASAERALSGPGLVNLYEALCAHEGVEAQPWSAADISGRALDGSDATCRAAIEMFFSLLGTVAGNLALTLGARGGVYIGGGIVPRLAALIDGSPLRSRFEQKGRFADYLRPIPIYVVNARQSPALLGAARALEML